MGSKLSRARAVAPSKLRVVIRNEPDWQTRPNEPFPAGGIEKREENMAVSLGKLEGDAEDPGMTQFFNKLGGSIANRPMQAQLWKDPIRRRDRRETLEDAEHRLSLQTLRALLEDAQRASRQSEPEQAVKELAASYDVDPELLEKVLRYNALPVCTAEENGRIVGRWPS